MWEPSERKFVQQAASTINITWSHGLPPGIPTPGIPIPKIIGIPVVGIKGYRPGIPTIEYIEHRLISRWQHTCHIVSTPIIVGH